MPFCHECGAARNVQDAKCSSCATPLSPVEAALQKPMTIMERAAAAASEAKKQASRLAEVMITCRQCGAQPVAGFVNSKYCTQCGVSNPSAASAAANVAAGALSFAQKGMMLAADKLDAYAKDNGQHGFQASGIQPLQPHSCPQCQDRGCLVCQPPPTPCPTCPECKGKGCSFCPAAAKRAAHGQ